MKSDIIISGVGGQGTITIAATIGGAALNNNLNIKQSEVHGMSQRGGSVVSNLRISDKEVFSDLIPFGGADIILSIEPMESLRYTSYLSENGWLVTNVTAYDNIENYPEMEALKAEIKKVKNSIILDANKIAKESGSSRSNNIVMLGAASHFIDIPAEELEKSISQFFNAKGEKIINANIKAFRAGREFVSGLI